MNKIYLEPISKAETLINGVKKQAEVLQKKGIVIDVERLQELCRALEKSGAEQESAEERLKEMRAAAHKCLDDLKEFYTISKNPIKQNFSPETWYSFGVIDKK